MKVLYVASEEEFSGVSAVCIGLSLKLKQEGYRVGYMKPLGYLPIQVGEVMTDQDASFVWELLEMQEPLAYAAPVVLTAQVAEQALQGPAVDYRPTLQEAFQHTAVGKDVFLLEGAWNLHQGRFLGLSGFDLVELFDAPMVLVERFDETNGVDKILTAQALLGERLQGILLNMIPPGRLAYTQQYLVPFLERRGLPVLGTIPWLSILQSASIQRLVEALQGQVLCAQDRLEELVEGVMIGAMNPEHALSYFRRKPRQAVVTGGDRADIQMAALQARASCVILTGNYPPLPIVLGEAEEKGIPMILVQDDTLAASDKVQWILSHARTHEPEKLAQWVKALEQHVKLPELHALLGLAMGGA